MFKNNLNAYYINEQYIISNSKKARAKTNLKSVIPQKYHNYLNIFLKKNFATLFPYQKYDNKVYFTKE